MNVYKYASTVIGTPFAGLNRCLRGWADTATNQRIGKESAHRECNAPAIEPANLFRIRIAPDHQGVTPNDKQKHFPAPGKRGRLMVAPPDGRRDLAVIHQDMGLYATLLKGGWTHGSFA
ncbi:MAG: hypothetical protein BMS9Abin22_641 [Gammaproteobacteria bacterium]|nr:MAG: hypothetical protein BMS9Abin22_641 [Gammaproteobacteria bacterium]